MSFNDGIVPALRSFTKQESDQILFYDANNGLEYVEDGSYANFDQPPPPRRQPVRNRHIRRRRSYSVSSLPTTFLSLFLTFSRLILLTLHDANLNQEMLHL